LEDFKETGDEPFAWESLYATWSNYENN
jgi:hypothetical protein